MALVHYLIIDVEATCWEGAERVMHAGENEIIEIGLAVVSPASDIVWHGGWFVRPLINPVLSGFCKSLTSIGQAQVDEADSLKAVLKQLERQVRESSGQAVKDCLFVSWGNYDRNQLRRDCARLEIDYPFGAHINLKDEFLRKHNLKSADVPKALSYLGLSFAGRHHRGADDALNIARIFIEDFKAGYAFKLRDAG